MNLATLKLEFQKEKSSLLIPRYLGGGGHEYELKNRIILYYLLASKFIKMFMFVGGGCCKPPCRHEILYFSSKVSIVCVLFSNSH